MNQAADTFDGNGDSFRKALRELSQTAGRLGDSRTDLFGTVRNLQVLVNALSNSNEQIVQFSNHVASVSQVLADSSKDLDVTLGTLNQALSDVKGFLNKNNEALIAQVGKLADFTQILTDHSDDIEQVLHITPNGLQNFYNIYNPAQGTVGGLLSLPNFANPVQFICGGTFDTGANPDNYKRAEICRQRMGPVFKRIAVNYPPMLFHPINSITAYKGQIIYDTPETEAKAQTPVPYLQWQPAPGVTPIDARAGRHAQRPDPAAARGAGPDLAGGPGARTAADGRWATARPAAWSATASRVWEVGSAHDIPKRVAREGIAGRPPHGGGRRGSAAAGRLPVRRPELAGHAGHRRARQRLLHHHRRTARRRHTAAELPGDGRRRHRRQRVGHRGGATARRHVLRGGEAVAGGRRQPAAELDGDGRADLAAGLPARGTRAAGGPAGRGRGSRRARTSR